MRKSKNIRTVEDILDLETGKEIKASSLLDNMDSDEIVLLRRKLRKANRESNPILVCAECLTKLELRCNKLSRESRGKDFYFFKHFKDVKECSIKTNSHLPVGVLLARKYENVKESIPHIKLKNSLGFIIEQFHSPEKLSIDSKFYFDKSGNGDKRKPDVYALIEGREYAFEIQLNTTFLSVIEEREAFYERNGVSIIWIFKNFQLEEEFQRLTQKDIYVPNRLNAFVLDDEMLDLSIKQKKLHFKVFYKTFHCDRWKINSHWENGIVTLTDLNFADNYKPFFYDSFTDKENAKKELERILEDDRLEQIQTQKTKEKELERLAKQNREKHQKILKSKTLINSMQWEIDFLKDENLSIEEKRKELERMIMLQTAKNQNINEELNDLVNIVGKMWNYLKSCINQSWTNQSSNPLGLYFDISLIKEKYCEKIKAFEKLKYKVKDKLENEILPRKAFINELSVRKIGEINYSIIPLEKRYESFVEKFWQEIKVIEIKDLEKMWVSNYLIKMSDISLFRWNFKNGDNSKYFLIDMSFRKTEALSQEIELTNQLSKISQDENLCMNEMKYDIVDLLEKEKDMNLKTIEEYNKKILEYNIELSFSLKKVNVLTKRRNKVQRYLNNIENRI